MKTLDLDARRWLSSSNPVASGTPPECQREQSVCSKAVCWPELYSREGMFVAPHSKDDVQTIRAGRTPTWYNNLESTCGGPQDIVASTSNR